MTPTLLLIVAVATTVIASAAACAVQILHEFWRHELEEYCLKRGNLDWFRQIIEQREKLALGAQTLQMFSLALATASFTFWIAGGLDPVGTSLWTFLVCAGTLIILLLITNCWIPWAMMAIGSVPFLYRTWRLWWLASLLLGPLIGGVRIVSEFFHRVSGQQPVVENEEETFEDEFLSMVSEGEHEGLIESDARDMIEGVFELDDSTVAKVMTPRSRVDFIDVSVAPDEMIRQIADFGRTRLPVVNGAFSKLSDVLGILFAKDLIREFTIPEENRRSLRELVRLPMVVPQSKPLDEMLHQFQAKRSHMAIVVDEYDSVAGVITIEDILEEIVGEIDDEMDEAAIGHIDRIDDRSIEADGLVRLDQLNDELGLALPLDEDFDTLSGLIMSHIGSIPQAGQRLTIDDIEIEVLQASRRAIERVRLQLPGADRNGSS